jgi:hypothetical protein
MTTYIPHLACPSVLAGFLTGLGAGKSIGFTHFIRTSGGFTSSWTGIADDKLGMSLGPRTWCEPRWPLVALRGNHARTDHNRIRTILPSGGSTSGSLPSIQSKCLEVVLAKRHCGERTPGQERRGMKHVGPKRRGMRLVVWRSSPAALATRLAMLISLSAGLLPAVARPAPDSSKQSAPHLIYHKGRNFRIPFNLNAEGRDRVKELKLMYSEDQGYHWDPSSRTLPDHPTFTFRAKHDGEYWFAVQTLTVDGKVSPKLDSAIEPNLKVVVDTFPPTLLLEQDGRRGSSASVRWEAKDENLNIKSLVLEYQVEGVGVWRRVPITRSRLTLIGSQQWDAGTAEPLKVRASVADLAGNTAEAAIELPEGAASQSDMATASSGDDEPPAGLPIDEGASPEITAGQGFTPVLPGPSPTRKRSAVTGQTGRSTRPASNLSRARRGPPTASEWDRDQGTPVLAKRSSPDVEPPPMDLFAAGAGSPVEGPPSVPSENSAIAITPSPGRAGAGSTLLVPSSKFKLHYAVDDAGPSGAATVELWITQDGGRTWIRRGDDQDRVSPIEIDLGGEGTFGICLVARSASGLGDQPPAPGDPPQSWVEVDSTPPAVQLLTPQVGTGANSGKVAIAWRASDLHLAPKSVSLSWRFDQPGAQWQTIVDTQENSGQYIWNVPATAPQRFHLKVEAVDTVGHHGSAETTDLGPVTVDRSRPRSRIIGLDPTVRSGAGPSARPMR